MIRRLTQLGLLALAVACLLPATAGATWGNKCSSGEGHHCYAVAEWPMYLKNIEKGTHEEVKGLSSEIETGLMDVPLWEDGDFVTNEQWAAFLPKGTWVEDGQIAGHGPYESEGKYVDCCSTHWFYAWEPANGTGFHFYEPPWTYPHGWWNSYTLSDPSNNGSWCFKIKEVTTTCTGAVFPPYSNWVEVGAEDADETTPENSGKDLTGVQHLNGNWYPWNEAYWTTEAATGQQESAYMCVTGYKDVAGDVNFATPNNLCGYE